MANTVSIHVQSIDDTNGGFEKVQKRFGDSMKAMGSIAAMAGPQLAAPLVAAAGASVAAFASVGAAVGAFGLAVAPQVKKIADLESNLKTMNPSVRSAAVQFRGLTDDMKKWSDSLAPKTMPVFTMGLQAMRAVLPQLTPLVETASGALTKFMGSILKGVTSGGFKSFLDDVNTSAKVALPDFLNSLKNIGVGFGGIIRAFLPFSGTMTGGLEKITAKFREFGQGLSGSKGFNDFMAGVKAVVPGVLQMFGDLAETAKRVSAAFMPFAGVMLGVVEAFAGLFASIDQDKLDFIIPMIAAIVVGMKAWAIVTGMVTAAQAGLTAAMGINPWTGAIIAVTALAVALYSTKDASDMAAMGLGGVGDAAASSQDELKEAAAGVGEAAMNVIKWVDSLGGLMPDLGGKTKDAADKMGDFGEGADFASSSVADFGEQTGKAAENAAKAAAKVGVFTDALRALADEQLAMSGSLIGLEASFDAAAEAVKKNGKTLDIHTPKGRANREALNGIASAALSVRDKMVAAGESGEAVVKRMNYARESFINLAVKMGLSSKSARTLADSLGLIKNKDVKVSARTAEAMANIKKMKDYIAGLHGKTLTITTYNRLVNEGKAPAYQHYAHGGIVGHAAEGGPRGGMTWVGEQGPELVSLAPGSTVHSAGDSKRIASSGPQLTSLGVGSGPTAGPTAALALKQLLDALDGKITTIRSKFNSVISTIKSKFEGGQEDSLVAYAKKQLAALEKLAVKRDKIAEKLADAKKFGQDIAQTAMGTASLSGLGATSGLGIKLGLENKLAKMRSFATALKSLAKKGLARALFQQIAELGPEGGLELAQDFLAMDKATFAQTNALQGQISKAAGQIGANAAETLMGTKALEKQLAVQQKAMDKVADRFADKIAAALLKVSSKSKSKKAGGGPAGGWTLVGEEGPEILNLPYGSSVMTAGATRRMAGNGGSSGGAIQLEWVGGNAGDDFMKWLKSNIRAVAGSGPNSVQTALS
jgi:hypothetical protein